MMRVGVAVEVMGGDKAVTATGPRSSVDPHSLAVRDTPVRRFVCWLVA